MLANKNVRVKGTEGKILKLFNLQGISSQVASAIYENSIMNTQVGSQECEYD